MSFSSCIPCLYGSWALTTLLFLLQERLLLPDSLALVQASVALRLVVVVLVLLIFNSFFFHFVACWNLPLASLYVRNCSLFCGSLSSPGFFLIVARGVGIGLLTLLVPQPIPRSIWLFLDAHVGKTPFRSFGIWSWIPQLPLLSVGGYLILW